MEAALRAGVVLVPSVGLCLTSDVNGLFLAVLLGGLALGAVGCWAAAHTAAPGPTTEYRASCSGEGSDCSDGFDDTEHPRSPWAVANDGDGGVSLFAPPFECQAAQDSCNVPDCGVRFRAKATEMEVPSLTALDRKHKARLWWQPEDLAQNQRVLELIRVLYGLEVSCGAVGTVEDDQWLEQTPLAGESCLGLNLGRDQLRMKRRQKYLAAVLAAQARQLPDTEVAREARRLSKRECRRAEEWAANQHRTDMGAEDNAAFRADEGQ
mmetsp:Transcript_63727/g.176747  ORF Transcript_63727/g.176747 Transcript_63727/m.176747 type:complete len:266 (+) Transcript_63727:103-900(+)